MKTIFTLKTILAVLTVGILSLSANSQVTPNPAPKASTKEISFTATLNNNKADLTWTAATEMKVNYFMVERSEDGVNFHDAAMVFAFEDGSDSLAYKFSDKFRNNDEAPVYYRLCMIAKDGNYTYSDIVVVRRSQKD